MNGAGAGDRDDVDGRRDSSDWSGHDRRTRERENEDDTGEFDSGADRHDSDTDRIRVDPTITGDDDAESTTDTGPPRDPDDTLADSGPEPGPNARRNWTTMLFALAVASFGTAAFIVAADGALEPAAGSAVLGLVFAALAGAAQTGNERIVEILATGWAENRRATWFATGLFALGTLFGIALLLAGYDLLQLVTELFEEELLPELENEAGEFELTATFFIVNNTQAFLLAIAGALTIGLLTVFVMVFNGIIVGNVAASLGNAIGFDYIVVGLAPHGVFELPALFIAAGVGFQLLYRFGRRLSGSLDAVFTKPYLVRTAAIVCFGWLLLVLAAFVEAYVTPALLEALFAERLEGANGTPLP